MAIGQIRPLQKPALAQTPKQSHLVFHLHEPVRGELMLFSAVLSTEGRVVVLCWADSKLKDLWAASTEADEEVLDRCSARKHFFVSGDEVLSFSMAATLPRDPKSESVQVNLFLGKPSASEPSKFKGLCPGLKVWELGNGKLKKFPTPGESWD